MRFSTLLLVLAGMTVVSYFMARRQSIAAVGGFGSIRNLHSLPKYYGYYVAIWCGIPGLLLVALWLSAADAMIIGRVVASLPAELQALPEAELGLIVNDIRNMAAGQFVNPDRAIQLQGAAERYNELKVTGRWIVSGLAVALGLAGWWLGSRRVKPETPARNYVEAVIRYALIGASMLAIVTTVGILLSVLFEATMFFRKVPITEFLFGTNWSPQTALRADQVGSSGSFGAIPLFWGTILISAIAMFVAMPIGLMTAIFLSEYATPKMRAWIKPALEILAGVPTVVYGYFAALTVGPLLRDLGNFLGLDVASESALGAGLVMGIMIIPFVSSLSDDVINAVPQAMRDGSYGLGATQSETVKYVVIPAALPGIVGGALLAVSRAIGETMIVVMAAGLAANLTYNPLEAVTTVTVQIVTLLVGDQEFDSAKTLSAFALGLVLFIVTLILNVIALRVVRKYREQYE
jgi:phosphate transport system permease protein